MKVFLFEDLPGEPAKQIELGMEAQRFVMVKQSINLTNNSVDKNLKSIANYFVFKIYS